MKKLKTLKVAASSRPSVRRMSEATLRNLLVEIDATEAVALEVMVAMSLFIDLQSVAESAAFRRRVNLAKLYFGQSDRSGRIENHLIESSPMCSALLKPLLAFAWVRDNFGGLPASVDAWLSDPKAALLRFKVEAETDFDDHGNPVYPDWYTGEMATFGAKNRKAEGVRGSERKVETLRRVIGVLVMTHFHDLISRTGEDAWSFVPDKRADNYSPPAHVGKADVPHRETFQLNIAQSVAMLTGDKSLEDFFPALAHVCKKRG